MSAADNKKSQLASDSNTGVYIWLVFISILIGAANLTYGVMEGAQNQQRLTKSGNLRVLSQQVAKNAAEASQGTAAAFELLEESMNSIRIKKNNNLTHYC